MSEVYREETRDDNGSEEEAVVLMTWESKRMILSRKTLWISMAKRLLDKVSIEKNPESRIDDLFCMKDRPPGLDPDAKQSSDVNVNAAIEII